MALTILESLPFVHNTGFHSNFLLRRMTCNSSITLDMSNYDPTVDDVYQFISYNPITPLPGQVHPIVGNMFCDSTRIEDGWSGKGGDPNHVTIISEWEGPNQILNANTGQVAAFNCLWGGSNGYLSEEMATLDAFSNPTIIPPGFGMGAPSNILNSSTLNSLMQCIDASIPKVTQLPRKIGNYTRKCVYYDINMSMDTTSAMIKGEFYGSQVLNSLLGTINSTDWGIASTLTMPAINTGSNDYNIPTISQSSTSNQRCWLFSSYQISTTNGSLFRIELNWVFRPQTWDEIGLYLTNTGNVLNNTNGSPMLPLVDNSGAIVSQTIPDRSSFPTNYDGFNKFVPSTTGGSSTFAPGFQGHTGQTSINTSHGWARFQMCKPKDWAQYFDIHSNTAPNLRLIPLNLGA